MMARTGLRPHVWKVQGKVPHDQHIAWLRMRAQAHYRGELWMLSFDDFQQLWQGRWHQRGRATDQYCLTRDDPDGAWEPSNVQCIQRIEHLRRQKLYKSRAGKCYG